MTWAYFYLMKEDAARVREVAPEHARYWQELHAPGWHGGPFSDRSGGLIVFGSSNENTADQAVARDPFQRAGLLQDWWLKAWEPAENDLAVS